MTLERQLLHNLAYRLRKARQQCTVYEKLYEKLGGNFLPTLNFQEGCNSRRKSPMRTIAFKLLRLFTIRRTNANFNEGSNNTHGDGSYNIWIVNFLGIRL